MPHTTPAGLTIRCGRSQLTLPTWPVEGGPAPLAVKGNKPPVELDAAALVVVFGKVALAAASNDQRPYLAGPLLFSGNGRLCAVGTNGGAMLLYTATDVASPDLGRAVIVHRRVCDLAVGLFRETGAAFRFDESRVELVSGSRKLVAKRVDAVPPEWRDAAPPGEAENFAVVDSKSLKVALERCLAIATDGDLSKRAPAATMQWHAAKASDEMSLSLGGGAAPSAADTVPAVELSGAVRTNIDPVLCSSSSTAWAPSRFRISAKDRR